ncbi:MAG: GGDEF domain-containing protein [Bacillota bacterium]|jgi:diguanylate cyclase (GGDEF)-like protein
MFSRLYLLKLFPTFFLWIGIGFFMGFLPLYLHENGEKHLLLEAYLLIQILTWFGLGFFFRKAYIYTYKDELTNLWNRRYLYIRLDDEIKKTKQNSVLALAIIDIDNFKCVNDTHGHLFGDKVLTEVAGILHNNLRKNDIITRWGGEEFILVLPKSDTKEAKAVLERIRNRVENYDFGCRITISVGVAFIKSYTEANKLIEKADKALYQAKRTKNIIEVYEK